MRALLALLLVGTSVTIVSAQDAKPAWRKVCVVIRQTGVVRDATEQEQRMGDIEFPCGWTDDEAMAAWRRRPDPVWGCGGFNMANPGKPNC